MRAVTKGFDARLVTLNPERQHARKPKTKKGRLDSLALNP